MFKSISMQSFLVLYTRVYGSSKWNTFIVNKMAVGCGGKRALGVRLLVW